MLSLALKGIIVAERGRQYISVFRCVLCTLKGIWVYDYRYSAVFLLDEAHVIPIELIYIL